MPQSLGSMPMTHKDGPAHVDLLALSRTAANTVTARFRIVNEGDKPIDLATSMGEQGPSLDPDLGDALSASGVGLLDATNDKMYFPAQKAAKTENCICTRLWNNPVKPRNGIDVYATFPSPPANVRRVTLVVPLSVPFQDVPISDDPIAPLKTQIDPAKVELKKPRVINVRALTEGAEQSVEDDSGQRSVQLSADVLFAVDKADLSPRAGQLLQQVAKQIDAARGAEIKVDGHADNTGSDAINQPLSERRAKAVADRLRGLVTRPGVSYRPAGHGSKEPVASNDTEEARRKNRRVSVTFARPAAPAPSLVNGTPYARETSGVLRQGTFQAPAAAGLKVQINSLHRDSSGLTIMVWTLRNTGQSRPDVGVKFEKTAANHGADPRPMRITSAGGVMLFDPANQVRYNSLNLDTGPCLCSDVGAPDAMKVIAPGQSIVYWNAYKPQANAAGLEVQVPWDRGADAVIRELAIR